MANDALIWVKVCKNQKSSNKVSRGGQPGGHRHE
jgi:hypothetical protein